MHGHATLSMLLDISYPLHTPKTSPCTCLSNEVWTKNQKTAHQVDTKSTLEVSFQQHTPQAAPAYAVLKWNVNRSCQKSSIPDSRVT
jgi:hypothetical protein